MKTEKIVETVIYCHAAEAAKSSIANDLQKADGNIEELIKNENETTIPGTTGCNREDCHKNC